MSLFTPAELADTMTPEDYRWMLSEAADEAYAEDGYIRWAESAGYEEARLQEEMEARMGIYTPIEDDLNDQWTRSQRGQGLLS